MCEYRWSWLREKILQRDQGRLLACTYPKVRRCLDLPPFEQPNLCKPFQEHQSPIPQVHTHSQSVNSNKYHKLYNKKLLHQNKKTYLNINCNINWYLQTSSINTYDKGTSSNVVNCGSRKIAICSNSALLESQSTTIVTIRRHNVLK